MTWVDYDPDELRMEIRGHAGGGDAGKDLICAAISTLTFSLMNAATDVQEYQTHLFMDEKNAVIRVECFPDQAHEDLCREMFRTVWRGYETIQEQFPDNITLTGGYDNG